MTSSFASEIIEYCNPSRHVIACANMVRHDLLHGPSYARLPAAGIEAITDDSLTALHEDALSECEPGDTVVEVYAGVVGDTLRAYIADLPSRLYVNRECGSVSDTEPQPEGWLNDDCEPCSEGDSGAVWHDDTADYTVYERRDIVRALFGSTVADEFY